MTRSLAGNARIAAARAVAQVLDEQVSLSESQAFSTLRDPRDVAFARNLAYGVMRWLTALQWLLAQLLAKPLKKRDRDIGYLMVLGLQQLWHDQTASHAAVNETAECARLLGKPWAVGLINAVLRRFQREQQELLNRLSRVPEHLAHPAWLVTEIRQDWPRQWQEVIAANNRQAPLWLRVNRLRSDRNTLGKAVEDAGFEVEPHVYAEDAVAITPASAVERIPGFKQGWFSVQDPAAQLARDLLDPHPDERILDACAAPGGKATHLLESCPQISLTVLDRQSERLAQVLQNFERLGLSAQTLVADAANTESWWDGQKFDKILLDAPCSATGVIRRHPDIKWLRSPAQVDTAVTTQAALLTALWPLLRTNGVLVYATCSILRRENSEQIRRFVDQNNDAHVMDIQAPWGNAVEGGRQILPGEAQMDGFFYAVICKKR